MKKGGLLCFIKKYVHQKPNIFSSKNSNTLNNIAYLDASVKSVALVIVCLPFQCHIGSLGGAHGANIKRIIVWASQTLEVLYKPTVSIPDIEIVIKKSKSSTLLLILEEKTYRLERLLMTDTYVSFQLIPDNFFIHKTE